MICSTGIEVRSLCREYRKSRTESRVALDDVTFAIPSGEVCCILGPNGAGKTTLVKILTTLLLPTSGTALVAGFDVELEPRNVARAVGVSFGGDRGLYARLTVADNLRFFGQMYGVKRSILKNRIVSVLEAVGLRERANDRVETLSYGMRQRLHIARSLVHGPAVLLLDEPSSGLDPESAASLRLLIAELRSKGLTILLTTHNLREAEALSDRVIVVNQGRVVAEESPSSLRDRAAQSIGVSVVAQMESRLAAAQVDPSIFPTASEVLVTDVMVEIRTRTPIVALEAFLKLYSEKVVSIATREPSLEDAYLQLVRNERVATPGL